MTREARSELSRDVETRLILIFVTYLYVVWYVVQAPTLDNWNGVSRFVAGIPSMLFMWFILQHIRELRLWAIILLAPIVCVFAEFLQLEIYALSTAGHFHWQSGRFDKMLYLFTLYNWTYFYLCWYFGFFVIVNYFKFAREALTASEIRAQNNQADLATMRYKLNPHFMFNTLNSISTLVLDDRNGEAETMVENLSRFLRFTIDKTPDIQVSLEEEIQVVQKYIDIERLRFSDKLDVTYDIDRETLDCHIPNLILQSLIEYLITHHILTSPAHHTLSIKTRLKRDMLSINCAIHGPLKHSIDERAITACASISSRLADTFGQVGTLELLPFEDDQQGFEIKTPKVTS